MPGPQTAEIGVAALSVPPCNPKDRSSLIFELSNSNRPDSTIGLYRNTRSCVAITAATPSDPNDCPVRVASIIFTASASLPDQNHFGWKLCGDSVHPRLSICNSDAGRSRMVIASTAAKPVGLLAHRPPSRNLMPNELYAAGNMWARRLSPSRRRPPKLSSRASVLDGEKSCKHESRCYPR